MSTSTSARDGRTQVPAPPPVYRAADIISLFRNPADDVAAARIARIVSIYANYLPPSYRSITAVGDVNESDIAEDGLKALRGACASSPKDPQPALQPTHWVTHGNEALAFMSMWGRFMLVDPAHWHEGSDVYQLYGAKTYQITLPAVDTAQGGARGGSVQGCDGSFKDTDDAAYQVSGTLWRPSCVAALCSASQQAC